tara:strand:- start:1228 stop:1695 length:468 start_codon:yes stop_codon:yes gene_type:complete
MQAEYIKNIALRCVQESISPRWSKDKIKIELDKENDEFVASSGKGEILCRLKLIEDFDNQRVYWAIEKGSYSTIFYLIEDVTKGFEEHITETFGIKRSPKPTKKKAVLPKFKKIIEKKKAARKCSVCKEPGHNKRTCPQRDKTKDKSNKPRKKKK